MVLDPDTLRARFQALGPSALHLYPITLDKGSQDVMVTLWRRHMAVVCRRLALTSVKSAWSNMG
jgi:hypothetical protein